MTADTPRWIALPQPSHLALEAGRWRPEGARVDAGDPAFAREADRLRSELAAAGLSPSGGAPVRLERAALRGEAFEIDVADGAVIRAGTSAGAFRATRQLLHNIRARGAVPRGRVRSAPVVAERALHLDAARKHFPAAWIADLLHALADIGISALQWHVSENEGFRIGSERFPEIVSARHVTREEALGLARLAADLHIELIPSLDMPGHLRHVLRAHPELRLPAEPDLPTDHALDIANERAVRFAHALVDDIAPLFPDSVHWNLGADEFVDFARIGEYPALAAAARRRHGADATGFDLLAGFANETAGHLAARGIRARVWNDGMLRGKVVALDRETDIAWWTNWHAEMRPLADALARGHRVSNANDRLFYYVLGEKAGYAYPTSERIWEADWHPGLFPSLADGTRQEIAAPYPPELLGAMFAIWSDDPDAQTADEVREGIRRPLRAMAERAWNGGSSLDHAAFAALDAAVGETGATLA